MTVNQIIAKFLKENPNYKSVEWEPRYNDLTVYFHDSTDPFSRSEFIVGTRTYNLLTKLEEELANADH